EARPARHAGNVTGSFEDTQASVRGRLAQPTGAPVRRGAGRALTHVPQLGRRPAQEPVTRTAMGSSGRGEPAPCARPLALRCATPPLNRRVRRGGRAPPPRSGRLRSTSLTDVCNLGPNPAAGGARGRAGGSGPPAAVPRRGRSSPAVDL